MNYHIILLKQFKMLKSSDQYFPPDLNPSFFFFWHYKKVPQKFICNYILCPFLFDHSENTKEKTTLANSFIV